MRNAGLEEVQAGIKIARRNINNLRYADDTTLMAQSKEELKPLTVWITTVENSSRDGNAKPPYLSPEKPECRSRSNCKNQTWNN